LSTIPLLRCPVTRLMLSIGIFFFAAFVMNPRRSEWPAKSPVTPAVAIRRRRIRATSPESSRVAVSCPRKSNVRKTGLAGPTIASRRSSAATAQSSAFVDVAGRRGTKSSRPCFSGPFLALAIQT